MFAAAVTSGPQGYRLQRLQIIKVWHDADGGFRQQVTDSAGNLDNGASVNLHNLEVSDFGDTQLWATWRDPQFQTDLASACYVRALEKPSCHWSWRQCLSLLEENRFAACFDTAVPPVIEQRA
ncbi:MAG: DUF3604 domain-containing protein [Halioglobus sp.]|nr:DUF3604 domain-containing protein [Halioglobus sp.]